MTTTELLRQRLDRQQITRTSCRSPAEVVEWMVAMQAQEYAMAKWAIGLRLRGVDEDAVERAFNAGEILRTHVLRPTWHFVAPADIRWLVALTAPRVHAVNGHMYRQLELDAAIFKRSDAALTRALHGGRFLERTELQTALARTGVRASGPRLAYVIMHAELEGLICSGPRQGRQFTYALLEERAPAARKLERDAALAELTRRFFASRGPATAQDFAYWSGLTVADARAGIAGLPDNFERKTVAGQTYVFTSDTIARRNWSGATFLMPDYDEYGMSYKDRSALAPKTRLRTALAFNRMAVVDGRVAGSWQRTLEKRGVAVRTELIAPLTAGQQRAVQRAVRRYQAFAGGG